jgi:hypothetical protein
MREIKTRTAKIFIDDNEVLHFIMTEGIHLDYLDALDNALVIKNITGGKAVLKLIDARLDWTIEEKAEKYIRSNEVIEKTIARAVVQGSALNKVLLNFFLKLNKTKVATKNFTDYAEAYNWLLSIKP